MPRWAAPARVTAVDVSESAVEMARANAERNGVSDVMDCVAANVFDLLPQLEKEPVKYDFIILDPPAFTKSRKTVANAITGYKEINYRAMKLLPRGGYSGHLLLLPLRHGGEDSRPCSAPPLTMPGCSCGRSKPASRACDHPILWGVDETDYLKFYLFQVV